MKSFLVARSYLVFVINTKSLIMDVLVTLETRLKVPIFAVFKDFLLFELSVLAQAFSLGKQFCYENVCNFKCSERLFQDIKLRAIN